MYRQYAYQDRRTSTRGVYALDVFRFAGDKRRIQYLRYRVPRRTHGCQWMSTDEYLSPRRWVVPADGRPPKGPAASRTVRHHLRRRRIARGRLGRFDMPMHLERIGDVEWLRRICGLGYEANRMTASVCDISRSSMPDENFCRRLSRRSVD